MKRILLIAALLLGTTAMARPVGPSRAAQVAELYFPSVKNITPAGWTEMYVFAPTEGTGFVVVAADDCVRPVLAYSKETPFDADRMPAHVASWFDGYRNEIASLCAVGAVASAQVQQQWMYGVPQKTKSSVSPLLTTTWDQSPRYNAQCPYSTTDSAYTVTGCVATATAQIMKYWNHPVKGHGEHGYKLDGFGYLGVSFDTTYHWDDMPNSLSYFSSQEQIDAVAMLMYHVGVAVEMGFGVHESGAYTLAYGSYNLPSSERALKEHFRYNPMLKGVWKTDYTDHVWDSLMRHELEHGRPILYTGRDDNGGHAFVIDGYDMTGDFHVNWGWGGWYDGYYTIDSLSPGAGGTGGNSTYTFNKDNSALIQIFPSYGNDTLAVMAAVSADSTQGTIVGNGNYDAYIDSVSVMAVPNDGYRFDGWASGFVVNPYRFVPNGDFSDTAFFAPLDADSLAYCDARHFDDWRNESGGVTEWGVRIPAWRRNATRNLDAVRLFVQYEGYYTMRIYYGDSIDDDFKVYDDMVDLTEAYGWTSVELPEPIALVGNKDLWITFRFASSDAAPAAMSYYSGIPDGSWFRLNGEWVCLADQGVYKTWMIAALFSERDYIVDLQADGYVGQGNVSGGGQYAAGASCTLSSAFGGQAPFVYWDFGNDVHISDDPYTFTVTQDTVILAVGSCIGIDDVEPDALHVVVEGRTVTLSAPDGVEATLYAVDGRPLGTGRSFTVPSAGVYLLRSAQGATQRIVIL